MKTSVGRVSNSRPLRMLSALCMRPLRWRISSRGVMSRSEPAEDAMALPARSSVHRRGSGVFTSLTRRVFQTVRVRRCCSTPHSRAARRRVWPRRLCLGPLWAAAASRRRRRCLSRAWRPSRSPSSPRSPPRSDPTACPNSSSTTPTASSSPTADTTYSRCAHREPNPADPNPADPNPADPNPADPNPADPNPADPNPAPNTPDLNAR